MKHYTKARIISALALVIFSAGSAHMYAVKKRTAGREAFVATQAELYDTRFAHLSPLREIMTALIAVGLFIAVYEAVAWFIYIFFASRDDSHTSHLTRR